MSWWNFLPIAPKIRKAVLVVKEIQKHHADDQSLPVTKESQQEQPSQQAPQQSPQASQQELLSSSPLLHPQQVIGEQEKSHDLQSQWQQPFSGSSISPPLIKSTKSAVAPPKHVGQEEEARHGSQPATYRIRNWPIGSGCEIVEVVNDNGRPSYTRQGALGEGEDQFDELKFGNKKCSTNGITGAFGNKSLSRVSGIFVPGYVGASELP